MRTIALVFVLGLTGCGGSSTDTVPADEPESTAEHARPAPSAAPLQTRDLLLDRMQGQQQQARDREGQFESVLRTRR